MGKLDGKVALISGGSSGIGLATAKEFVNEGAYVFITGRRDPELQAAVITIGRNVRGARGDVSKLDDLDRLFAQIKDEKGKLDIVFANAGIAKYAPLGKITEELFDSIFDIKREDDLECRSTRQVRHTRRDRQGGSISCLRR
jgi:NAD(P)-dependent dehydrogenase (short-subunit alcohol dehydrogenase family)